MTASSAGGGGRRLALAPHIAGTALTEADLTIEELVHLRVDAARRPAKRARAVKRSGGEGCACEANMGAGEAL